MTVHNRGMRVLGSAALWAGLALAIGLPQPDIANAGAKAAPRSLPAGVAARRTPPPVPVYVSPATIAAQRDLDARVQEIGRSFSGDVGIAVRDVLTGWSTHFEGEGYFPQQSVSKFWVTLTALDKADRGALDLYAPVTVRNEDLTLFNQPIRAAMRNGSFTTTLDDLIRRAMQQSDNTANDFILRRAGGPDAVRGFIVAKGIEGIRFGPGERAMQSQIAGLSWRPEYSTGNRFHQARSSLAMDTRRSSLQRYLADPVDGATPLGLTDALARLKKGELLSSASTQRLLAIMSNTRTGPKRLKGGLPTGWSLAHKTGTGQVLGSTHTGYNDIGIVNSPGGRSYAVAVMIRETSAPIPTRMAMMQSVTRAVADYDRRLQGGGYGMR